MTGKRLWAVTDYDDDDGFPRVQFGPLLYQEVPIYYNNIRGCKFWFFFFYNSQRSSEERDESILEFTAISVA